MRELNDQEKREKAKSFLESFLKQDNMHLPFEKKDFDSYLSRIIPRECIEEFQEIINKVRIHSLEIYKNIDAKKHERNVQRNSLKKNNLLDTKKEKTDSEKKVIAQDFISGFFVDIMVDEKSGDREKNLASVKRSDLLNKLWTVDLNIVIKIIELFEKRKKDKIPVEEKEINAIFE